MNFKTFEMPEALRKKGYELSLGAFRALGPDMAAAEENVKVLRAGFESGFSACWEELSPVVASLRRLLSDDHSKDIAALRARQALKAIGVE